MFLTALIILLVMVLYIIIFKNNKIAYVFFCYFISIAMILIISALYISKVGTYAFTNEIDRRLYMRLSRIRISLFNISRIYNLFVSVYMMASVVVYMIFNNKRRILKTVLLTLPIFGFYFINDPAVTWEIYRVITAEYYPDTGLYSIIAYLLPYFDVVLIFVYLYFPVLVFMHVYRKTKLKFKGRYLATIGVSVMMLSSCMYYLLMGNVFPGIGYMSVDLTKLPETVETISGHIIMPIIIVTILIVVVALNLYVRPFELVHIRNVKRKRNIFRNHEKDIAKVLHTYKNSVCVMSHIADSIERRVEEEDLNAVKRNAIMLKELAGEQIDALNKAITGFSKPDKYYNSIDLVYCIKNAVQKANISSDVNVNVQSCYEQVFVMGDVDQITDVFLNLLYNSITAMEKKRDGDYEKRIDILIKNEDEYILTVIRDNGIGIKKSEIKDIFKPFYTTGDRKRNSGMGLSSVEEVVSAYNGHIEVNSKYGEYAEFAIVLPRINKSIDKKGETTRRILLWKK